MNGKGPWLVLLLAGLCFAPVLHAEDAKPEQKDPNAFFTDFLDGLTVGEGIATEKIVVFPLIAKEPPKTNVVVPDTRTDQVIYEELAKPKKPMDVGITNKGTDPVLLLGGGLLVGGKLDRLIPKDTLIPGKHQVELETLVAEYPADQRAQALPFRRGTALAPEFLRERAAFDPARFLVPIFVSHFLEFRNPGDERRSLQAIDSSATLAGYCLECQRAIAEFPDIDERRVVGFATTVRGRLHAVELFGTNDLLRAWFGPILRAHTYVAAAIALRAEEVGLPIPSSDKERANAMKQASKDLQKLIETLVKHANIKEDPNAPGMIGRQIQIRAGSTDGVAIGYQGRLLHAALFPEDAFEEAVFSQPLAPPTPQSGTEESFGELQRRAKRGTLTEYEKRLLERMRERRK